MVEETASLPPGEPDLKADSSETSGVAAVPRPPSGPPPQTPGGPVPRPRHDRGARSNLLAVREPLDREAGGYRLRLDILNLAKLRELPGSRGKSDTDLGKEFFDGHAARLAAALAGEVTPPAEVRVVVDPYTRQAFLAVENRVRGIVSF